MADTGGARRSQVSIVCSLARSALASAIACRGRELIMRGDGTGSGSGAESKTDAAAQGTTQGTSTSDADLALA